MFHQHQISRAVGFAVLMLFFEEGIMEYEEKWLHNEIERALDDVAQEYGQTVAHAVRALIYQNKEKKRLAYFMDNVALKHASRRVRRYVYLVAHNYAAHHSYVQQVQIEQDAEVWDTLFTTIQQWAYAFLLRHKFRPSQETLKLAQEYATDAAMAVLQSDFPYDTEWEAWVRQIVINQCCNHIDTWKQQKVLAEKMGQQLLEGKSPNVLHDGIEARLTNLEDVTLLHAAIKQLKNPKMRQVIWLRYYGELSSQQIAEVIGSSYRYVDKLHFQAKPLLLKALNDLGFRHDDFR